MTELTDLTDWKKLHDAAFAGQSALVTGGAGFIGSHLANALNSLGAKVTVLDDLSGGGDPSALDRQIKFVKGSILDASLLQNCTEGCQLVFHQAALGSVPRSVAEPVLFQEVNATGTVHVMEAARAAGVRRVMFASSSSVYGGSPVLPKIESMLTTPRSPYAATKAEGESILSAYTACYPIDAVCLRYFNIFGPRQSADNAYAAVIAAFAKAIVAGRHPTIFGDGEQSRDFTYVDNVVHANLLAARCDKRLDAAAINIACGARITVTELAVQMTKGMNRPDLTPVYAEDRPGDVRHSVADLGAAKKLLGYSPIVAFSPGLSATLQWYKLALGQSDRNQSAAPLASRPS